jgi:hypothetical protein
VTKEEQVARWTADKLMEMKIKGTEARALLEAQQMLYSIAAGNLIVLPKEEPSNVES